ncbi:thioredoxin family protein [Carboxylicivirga sp. A043]|uniref:thioredoxin family protein n=1 Tax=Carboxylicivirga litoralis TaxID=2816963 RepID=UPI0021CAF164|nr:thioredoxin family protein [Carboxylicivirga sp. A043]MCU4156109.1 thioredoxin family protein [Carboxylicivirga sp. A043]
MKKIIPLLGMLMLVQHLASQNWQTDFATAQQLAGEKQQAIVLVFQGSDWCAPCMKLEREIFDTDEFKTYAQKHLVMLKADFPRRKKNKLSNEQEAHNRKLAEKYNTEGYFPLVVVMDSTGKVLGKLGYENVSVANYIKKIEGIIK